MRKRKKAEIVNFIMAVRQERVAAKILSPLKEDTSEQSESTRTLEKLRHKAPSIAALLAIPMPIKNPQDTPETVKPQDADANVLLASSTVGKPKKAANRTAAP